MTQYTTIRISVEDKRRLKELALRERRSILQQIGRLIDQAEAERLVPVTTSPTPKDAQK